jgi:arylsulfatase A
MTVTAKSNPTNVASQPVDWSSMKVGATLTGDDAPQLRAKPFSIMCTVETSLQNTVILAHGGLSQGYALYLKQGHLCFLVRTGAADLFEEITYPSLLKGSVKVEARLNKDGLMSLLVDDEKVITKAAKLLSRQPAEPFCLGHDSEKPVGNYDDTKPFEGSVKHLKISSP